MKDDLTRRSFLKAAGLAVAGVTGTSLLSRSGWAQEQQEKEEEKNLEEDKAEQEELPEEPEKSEEPEEPKEEEPNYDDLFEEKESEEPAAEETRACPQCGALMYRQGRTWTCENCGYSYVE